MHERCCTRVSWDAGRSLISGGADHAGGSINGRARAGWKTDINTMAFLRAVDATYPATATVLGERLKKEEQNGVAFSSCNFDTSTDTALQTLRVGRALDCKPWWLTRGEQMPMSRCRQLKARDHDRNRIVADVREKGQSRKLPRERE